MTKFYPLQHDEWSEVRQKLKHVEIVVLYHLRTLDPFGINITRLNVTQLAKDVGINRSTASRALKVLDRHGYIKMQLHEVSVTLNSVVKKGNDAQPINISKMRSRDHTNNLKVSPTNQEVCSTEHNLRSYDRRLCSTDHSLRSHDHTNTLKTQSGELFQKPLDLLDYSDYKDQIDQESVCLSFESEVSESADANPEDVKRCIEEIRKHLEMDDVKAKITIKEVKTELVVENQLTEIAVDQPTEVKAEIAVDQPKEELKVKTKLLLQTLNSGEGQNFPQLDVNLKNFIVNAIETKRGIKLTNPDAYVAKCLKKDGDHWQSLYEASLKPKIKASEPRMEFWSVEQTLNMAIKNNDLEFAIARFQAYPEYQERVLSNHPDWTEKLTGKRHKTEPQVKVVANTDVISGRLAMLQAKLNLRFLQPQQRLETEAQITVLRDLLGLNRGEMAYASA